ncbi:Response regulator receiver domain-containing protein [Cribrihabitans marinus]|uniref:Response regulator receiver domain-containing protein n=1 Tax=Cribrihabitans marinus TaxID=1227549 RepID=A0A1H7DQJ8_9RHOB|nr:hypothetical protein GCM10010973_35600 [Cribrihabitans marinus]SEK04081.1 Response regulator receiver domain-containing protein [Cribrihabitans marinus]
MLRVLVVDDDPGILQLLEATLRAFGGYEVQTARNADAALEVVAAQVEPFDGVFLDIQMPGCSGIVLCGRLRQMRGYADIPIIMLTAMSEQKYLNQAFALGASDYITKPFELNTLRMRFARERRNGRVHGINADRPHDGAQGDGSREDPRCLSEAFPVAGFERCVRKEAFENLVFQSSGLGRGLLNVRAVKLIRPDIFFSRLSARGFRHLMDDLALAVSIATESSGDLITHCGNGIFLCLGTGPSDLDPAALAVMLQSNARMQAAADRAGLSCRVAVGRQVPLAGLDRTNVLFGLEQAVTLVEEAEARADGWANYADWKDSAQSRGREQSRLEQRAYERMLRELMSGDERPDAP